MYRVKCIHNHGDNTISIEGTDGKKRWVDCTPSKGPRISLQDLEWEKDEPSQDEEDSSSDDDAEEELVTQEDYADDACRDLIEMIDGTEAINFAPPDWQPDPFYIYRADSSHSMQPEFFDQSCENLSHSCWMNQKSHYALCANTINSWCHVILRLSLPINTPAFLRTLIIRSSGQVRKTG